jgi:hypothetical protein
MYKFRIVLHGSTSQKTILNIILAAVRTWNLTTCVVRICEYIHISKNFPLSLWIAREEQSTLDDPSYPTFLKKRDLMLMCSGSVSASLITFEPFGRLVWYSAERCYHWRWPERHRLKCKLLRWCKKCIWTSGITFCMLTDHGRSFNKTVFVRKIQVRMWVSVEF